jgi:putative endonuclease
MVKIHGMGAYVYIVLCQDGSFYTGSTRGSLEDRVNQHNAGSFGGYTITRRPVRLVYSEYFDRIMDAVSAERQIKGWSRAKKEALLRGDFDALKVLSRRRSQCILKRLTKGPAMPISQCSNGSILFRHLAWHDHPHRPQGR